MGGTLWRRQRIIDNSPIAICTHLNLDGISPVEVVRFVEKWAFKAAIIVLSRRGDISLIGDKEVQVRIGDVGTKFSATAIGTSSVLWDS